MGHTAAELLPHKAPMLFVDYAETGQAAEAAFTRVGPDWILLDKRNELAGAAFFEIMAQGFGLISASRFVSKSDEHPADATTSAMDSKSPFLDVTSPSMGFLVGVKKFSCPGTAEVGELLRISIANQTDIGAFSVFDALVHNEQGELLASAQLKVVLATAEILHGGLNGMVA